MLLTDIEKILESIKETEFTFSLAGDFKTVNRPEDGYQPSGDAKIIYFMGETKVGESSSIADSLGELDHEMKSCLGRYQTLLEHRGYACQVKGQTISARKKISI